MYGAPRPRHFAGPARPAGPAGPMGGIFGREGIKMGAIFETHDISPAVSRHLQRVYLTVLAGILVFAAGACWSGDFYSSQFKAALRRADASLVPTTSWLWAIAFIGSSVLVSIGEAMFGLDMPIIAGLYGLSTFSAGVITAPLLALAALMNTSIIATAAVITAATFGTLSYIALRSQKRSWLFLGSYLSLGVWSLLASSFLGRLLGTPIFHSIEVYFGLAVFMGYVLFDTQLIIARAEESHVPDAFSTRVIKDAMQLFTDVLSIFIRLLVILMEQEQQRRRRDDRRDNRR